MSENNLMERLVNAFLCWRLPDDFAPDAGISFNPGPTQHMPHCWPVGTNLLTAAQAKAMFQQLFASLPDSNYSTEEEGDAYAYGWFDGNASVPYEGNTRASPPRQGLSETELAMIGRVERAMQDARFNLEGNPIPQEIAFVCAIARRRATPVPAPSVGLVLVPREPTEAMQRAADEFYCNMLDCDLVGIYQAMLAAAPPTAIEGKS
jgi:hypothetical protein